MANASGRQAIVIGGSMAGLLAARVLSDHFTRVTIVERDILHDAPEARKGQPHARHIHALLARGFQVLTRYFPDLPEALQRVGVVPRDMARTMRWYCFGDYRIRFEFGIPNVLASRPLLEWLIRQRVVARPNVLVMDGGGVTGLLAAADQTAITGVRLTHAHGDSAAATLDADLVIDATGRGSQSPTWLAAHGYARPAESVVTCGVGYATRLYRRQPDEPGSEDWVFVTPEAPRETRGGAAFPIEGDRWIVSLGGWHGDHPPMDATGFLAFAQSLPAPDVYNIVSRAEPLSDIYPHKYPSSVRRHYEKLARFPDGYLVLGDAVCSFNPLYGQGITSAALQMQELDRLLRQGQGGLAGIARPFFKRSATLIDIPWQTAVAEDFRFPETRGRKAPGTDLINAYVARVHRATHHDALVGEAFLQVLNMLAPRPVCSRRRSCGG